MVVPKVRFIATFRAQLWGIWFVEKNVERDEIRLKEASLYQDACAETIPQRAHRRVGQYQAVDVVAGAGSPRDQWRRAVLLNDGT
jgi:hypothetical protein